MRSGVAALAAACAVAAVFPALSTAEAQERIFDLAIVRGALPAAQRLMRVEKGDVVRWRITSDAPGELHLHAYRLQATLAAGQPVEISFKAFATGRYRVEWHAAAGTGAAGGAHHGPPLATLEVRPR